MVVNEGNSVIGVFDASNGPMRLTIPGRHIGGIKTACKPACKRAGIVGFTLHGLRHTAINNWRLQGHDYFRIMAATGHKTMTVFKHREEGKIKSPGGGENLRHCAGENLTQ
jgi:integrase